MDAFKNAAKWIEKAKHDIVAADILLSAQPQTPYDVVCFHCQQAAEKLLKGYLVRVEKEFPFTHNLVMLSEIIHKSFPDCKIEKIYCALDILDPYSVAIRYPGDIGLPQSEDAIEARGALTKVYEWIKSEFPELFDE
jgi:HEPN domain-containing protein